MKNLFSSFVLACVLAVSMAMFAQSSSQDNMKQDNTQQDGLTPLWLLHGIPQLSKGFVFDGIWLYVFAVPRRRCQASVYRSEEEPAARSVVRSQFGALTAVRMARKTSFNLTAKAPVGHGGSSFFVGDGVAPASKVTGATPACDKNHSKMRSRITIVGRDCFAR